MMILNFQIIRELSINPSIHPSIHLFIHLSIHPSIHLSIHLSIHPSIHPLLIYLSIQNIHRSILEQIIPKHLRQRIHPDDIRRKHHEYSDIPQQECNEAFMAFVQQWPLYGSTVFEVVQAYTTTLPKNLWLVVNEIGIHILKRRDKEPLVTYEYKNIVNYRSVVVNC